MSIKVLHIVGGNPDGGAARGAYWLHLALLENNIDSILLNNGGSNSDENLVITLGESKKVRLSRYIRFQLDRNVVRLYRRRKAEVFSTGLWGADFTLLEEYKKADIVHFHWINGGFVNLRILKKIHKPIVWTMRDMWPFTGGCHYSLDCQNYKTGCGNCRVLNSKTQFDISRYIFKRKSNLYRSNNINFIGISNWITDRANESLVIQGKRAKTIFNNIDTAKFAPINKTIAKGILSIGSRKNVVLIGATNLQYPYKGFQKFLDCLNFLNTKNYLICTFGTLQSTVIEKMGFEHVNFGYLNDIWSLRLIYSAANVFVGPSLMEAFGKTLCEAMSCKTPVVCFDATGPKDIVSHKVDGYKAEPFHAHDLAEGIRWICENDNYEMICEEARNNVVRKFDSMKIAGEYRKIYKTILNASLENVIAGSS